MVAGQRAFVAKEAGWVNEAISSVGASYLEISARLNVRVTQLHGLTLIRTVS